MIVRADRDLYRRGMDTVLASWAAYARGTRGAALVRAPGVAAAVFPREPERSVYNNAVPELGQDAARRAAALGAMESAYAAAGVTRFAVWAHESDRALRADLERRGYTLDQTTRAMAMELDDIRLPRPQLDLAPPDWSEHLRMFDLPPNLLAGADHSAFHISIVRLGGESVSAAIAIDHGGDCGIYNVGTVARARRRGLATTLTALQLHDARARGCTTASLQSTPMAERVYAAAGFRDLGRILEYVPRRPTDSVRRRTRAGRTPSR